jgi:hypothetical protein
MSTDSHRLASSHLALYPEGGLTPERVVQILEENRIEPHELSHLDRCFDCYGWLRAFSALKGTGGNRIELKISSAPRTHSGGAPGKCFSVETNP